MATSITRRQETTRTATPVSRMHARQSVSDLREIDASIRPVEMYWKNERLVVRTPGVKVYLDIEAPWGNDAANYEPADDEAFDVDEYSPCDYEPSMRSIHGDAVSGKLLLEYDHDRIHTSCLCDSVSYTEVVQAPRALFDRLDRLATVAD